MFFSFFGPKMYFFARKLLRYCLIIGCFVFIWVFGNQDYFPERHSPTPLPTISGQVINKMVFKPTKNEIGAPTRVPGYTQALIERFNDSTFSQIAFFFLVFYAIFSVVNYLFRIFRKHSKSKKLKNGISDFGARVSETQFEDQVTMTDVVYAKSLAHLMKGREKGCKELIKMNKDRLKRLTRNIKRKKRKRDGIMGVGSLVNIKVSLARMNSAAKESEKEVKRRATMTATELTEGDEFLTLSSYDHKVRKSQKIKNFKFFAFFVEFETKCDF